MPDETPSQESSTDARKRILIVEDDPALSGVYITKFEKEGFAVRHASNGEEAIAMAEEQRPDAVLLDLMLPKLDGYQVLQKLKENAELQMVPVIVLSNLSKEEDAKKAIELGAVEYLVKIYNLPSDVVAKVREHMGEG